MRGERRARLVRFALLALLLGSCAKTLHSVPVELGGRALQLAGIGPCNDVRRSDFSLDPARPLVVLVHGCRANERTFRALAEVFALHDRQTVCFRYDDRERLRDSAQTLRHALGALAAGLEQPDILVLGHSQGGLVARAALTHDMNTAFPRGQYRLVTVASPFGGIRAANHCGSVPLHIASLGVTVAVCRAITGAKWNEIHPRAAMVRAPRALAPSVHDHLTIVTDERDTCRKYSADGRSCEQDDYVFSVAEQHNVHIERDHRVVQNAIAAGHAEAVGAQGATPQKLLEALQKHGFLRQTDPQRRVLVERLTSRVAW